MVDSSSDYKAHLDEVRSRKQKRLTQREIVRAHRDAIINMIRHDNATVEEVRETLKAMDVPILDDGFAAAVRAELGTVADIRSGKLRPGRVGRPRGGRLQAMIEVPVSDRTQPPASPSEDSEDDPDFGCGFRAVRHHQG